MSLDKVDEKILTMLKSGSVSDAEKGMRLMMETYQKGLFNVVFKVVGQKEDTADVLQNCFIKAFRGIQKFEEKSKLFSWLYRIAMNESFTFLEKKKKKVNQSSEFEMISLAHHPKADNDLRSEKIEKLLADAINNLPEKQKMVFLLRYYEEIPYEKISQQLGISEGGLKASYHHALKKVEAFLKSSDLF